MKSVDVLGGRGPEPCLEIEFPSRTELVTVVRMIVVGAAKAQGALEGERLDDLRWVVSESVTNAVRANLAETEAEGEASRRVLVRACFSPGEVRLVIADEGPGFAGRPPLPDITAPERLEVEGGFGIPLMQSLSSEPLRFDSGPSGTTLELALRQD